MKISILLAAIISAAIVLVASKVTRPISQSTSTTANAIEEKGLTAGIVRKLDSEQQKITLKHEAIERLGMPPMTMVFSLEKASLAENVKVGDRVMFRAERIDGGFCVTRLKKQEVSP